MKTSEELIRKYGPGFIAVLNKIGKVGLTMKEASDSLSRFSVKNKIDRQKRWDLRFLRMIRNEICTWSKDPSTQCGAIIAKDVNKFVSLGYNGYPKGVKDDASLSIREQKYPKIIHAEKNAILFAQRDLSGMTIYVYPLAPCAQCAAYIIQSGISRVVCVIPDDEERKKRWEDSNMVAFEMFKEADVECAIYFEDQL